VTSKALIPHKAWGLKRVPLCGVLEKNRNNVETLEKQIYSENQHNVHEKCGLAAGKSVPAYCP
jgi:hypothetical protein